MIRPSPSPSCASVRLAAYLHPLSVGDVGAPRRQAPGTSPVSFPSPSASPSLALWLTIPFSLLQVSLRGSSAKEITRDALLQKVSEERQLRSHLRRAAAAAFSIQVPPTRSPPPNPLSPPIGVYLPNHRPRATYQFLSEL